MFLIPKTNFYIGNKIDFAQNLNDPDFTIVNLADNLHREILGYRPRAGDPNYILFENERIISANFVDTDKPKFYDWENGGVSVFTKLLDFIDSHKSSKVLITCSLAESRSPSMALLYLAKRLNMLDNSSFEEAKKGFLKIYPNYNPKLGIQLFLSQKWSEIV